MDYQYDGIKVVGKLTKRGGGGELVCLLVCMFSKLFCEDSLLITLYSSS